MKKIFAIILSSLLICTLAACDIDISTDKGDKPQDGIVTESTDQNNSSTATDKLLTREEAIEIALDHAGFKENEVVNLTAELDKDISISEWEIEFDKGGYEYSYDIDAASGEITKNEKEID